MKTFAISFGAFLALTVPSLIDAAEARGGKSSYSKGKTYKRSSGRSKSGRAYASGGRSSAATYYVNCSAARAAGAAPVMRGDPGYSPKLDRDGDGVGCE